MMLHGADYRKDASPALPVPRHVDIRSGGSGPEQAVVLYVLHQTHTYARCPGADLAFSPARRESSLATGA
jgi:hypothetical protein